MSRPTAIRDRDLARLAPIVPELARIIATILDTMDRLGYPMLVTDGVRTKADQWVLYQKGRKLENGLWVPIDPIHHAGIVTDCDGTKKISNHQIKADKFGYAVDCTFLVDGPNRNGITETPTWDSAMPFQLYGVLGETLGTGHVTWGGRWQQRDMPHLEWRP